MTSTKKEIIACVLTIFTFYLVYKCVMPGTTY